jgi:hypothetical protein
MHRIVVWVLAGGISRRSEFPLEKPFKFLYSSAVASFFPRRPVSGKRPAVMQVSV